MSTRLSQFNNTGIPLNTGATFTGLFERTLTGLEISTFVNCSGLCLVTIQQSVDASNVRITTTFNYDPENDVSTFSVPVGLPFFRVKIFNGDVGTQAYLSLNTYIINTPPLQVNIIGGEIAVSSVGGIVEVSGNVISTPALVPAQLRNMPLVVGHWYQVASPGNTPGSVWNEMGAIVASESLPPVGRQFQCLYAGYGTGTCYDITAPVKTTAITNVDVSGNTYDGYGGLNVNVANWTTGTTISVGLDTDINTVKIDAANNLVSLLDSSTVTVSSITQALPVGTNVIGVVGFDLSGGANTIAISQNGNDNGVQVLAALPAGSNVIGKVALDTGGNVIGVVGLDTALNTVKIDQANNGVKVNPTAVVPVRATGLSNTAVSIGGPGLLYGASYQNKSSMVNCWIKLYDNPTAPSATDTPFLIQYLEAVQQYNLSHANQNFFNTPITNNLWVRATLTAEDTDTTDTGVDCEVTFFVGT